MKNNPQLKIVVGGVCGSGKTTLAKGLLGQGYCVRTVAQEHSMVPHMFLMSAPNYVIYLQCSYETIIGRNNVGWTKKQIADQEHRLRKMRADCDLKINTDNFTVAEVLKIAITKINHNIIREVT